MSIGFANFTQKEKDGKNLFENELRCGNCHTPPTFTPAWESFANIGLDVEYEDKGLGVLSSNSELNGYFKVPGLKNVAMTAPYMHDGRYTTLMEVIEHYNSGVENHPSLSWEFLDVIHFFQTGILRPMTLNLTQYKKKALVAFMRTLTDLDLTTNQKFSDPF